jgi:hypothetical protein
MGPDRHPRQVGERCSADVGRAEVGAACDKHKQQQSQLDQPRCCQPRLAPAPGQRHASSERREREPEERREVSVEFEPEAHSPGEGRETQQPDPKPRASCASRPQRTAQAQPQPLDRRAREGEECRGQAHTDPADVRVAGDAITGRQEQRLVDARRGEREQHQEPRQPHPPRQELLQQRQDRARDHDPRGLTEPDFDEQGRVGEAESAAFGQIAVEEQDADPDVGSDEGQRRKTRHRSRRSNLGRHRRLANGNVLLNLAQRTRQSSALHLESARETDTAGRITGIYPRATHSVQDRRAGRLRGAVLLSTPRDLVF